MRSEVEIAAIRPGPEVLPVTAQAAIVLGDPDGDGSAIVLGEPGPVFAPRSGGPAGHGAAAAPATEAYALTEGDVADQMDGETGSVALDAIARAARPSTSGGWRPGPLDAVITPASVPVPAPAAPAVPAPAPVPAISAPVVPVAGVPAVGVPAVGVPAGATPAASAPGTGPAADTDVPRLHWGWPLRMVNPVRSHGWGAKDGLAGVQRRPAGRRPEAELWIGAHPVASSALLDQEGREIPLLEAIDVDPGGLLGRLHRNRFGARLPFLLKVLAVDKALAVQAHPPRRQAAEGFARQEAASIPLRSGSRTYVDPHAKPELLVALTPFDALVGLREPRHAAHLLDLLDVAPLVPVRRALGAAAGTGHGPARDATLQALVKLAGWPFRQRAVLTAGVSDAARAALVNPLRSHHPETRSALEWVIRLADQHPGDPLVLAPLLLEFVHLEPGGTVFVPPGVLHTFLHGVALEAAGSSANVIRAGLTRRPVDPEAVEVVVEVSAHPIVGVGTEPCGRHETAYLVPAEEFRLSRIALAGTGVVAPVPRPAGPQIVLCLDGEVEVGVGPRLTHLCSGESAFLGPEAVDVVLSGEGTVYRVTAGG